MTSGPDGRSRTSAIVATRVEEPSRAGTTEDGTRSRCPDVIVSTLDMWTGKSVSCTRQRTQPAGRKPVVTSTDGSLSLSRSHFTHSSHTDLVGTFAAVQCGDPGSVDNADRSGDPRTNTVTYTCRSEFQMEGEGRVTCSCGQWSARPRCIRVGK